MHRFFLMESPILIDGPSTINYVFICRDFGFDIYFICRINGRVCLEHLKFLCILLFFFYFRQKRKKKKEPFKTKQSIGIDLFCVCQFDLIISMFAHSVQWFTLFRKVNTPKGKKKKKISNIMQDHDVK